MKRKKLNIAIGLVLFLIIGIFVLSGKSNDFDIMMQTEIFSMRNASLSKIMKNITLLGSWQIIVLISAMILVKTRKKGLTIASVTAISTMIYKIVKELFGRERPDISLHLINQGGLSFPSGHAMNGIVFYGLIIYILYKNEKEDKKVIFLSSIIILIIFLIGFSRIYLGVHYPTDVLAGWCLGFAYLNAAIYIIEKHTKSHL